MKKNKGQFLCVREDLSPQESMHYVIVSWRGMIKRLYCQENLQQRVRICRLVGKKRVMHVKVQLELDPTSEFPTHTFHDPPPSQVACPSPHKWEKMTPSLISVLFFTN